MKKDFKKAAALCEVEIEGNDYIGALRKLPARLLKMFVHAYQSYLWNESIKDYLSVKYEGKEIDYSQGKLFFVDEKKVDMLKIPLIGFDNEGNEKIMQNEEITTRDFVIRQIPELSMEGDERDVFVEVKTMEISELEKDELNENMKKVTLKFSLSKGSYATMVVRKLFL